MRKVIRPKRMRKKKAAKVLKAYVDKPKKTFVLQKGGKDSSTIFTNRQPRGAALKAARRGIKNIQLRERGTKKIHKFKGSLSFVAPKPNTPDWAIISKGEHKGKMKVANVKKQK